MRILILLALQSQIEGKAYPRSGRIASDHDNWAYGPIFRHHTSRLAAKLESEKANLEPRSAHLVVRTRIAPAFISKLALTADMATDSSILTGF